MKKQEKKFVLAGIVLLAITMVLLPLAGCKNDTVPPEVEKQEQGDGGGSETDKNDTVPEPTRYTVKFDKNAEDASGEMQSQIFTEGVEQELSVNQFKRDTYTFSGWSEDKAATAPTYKDKAKFKATKDTTLYAVWTDNGTVALVTFSPASGDTLYYGDTVTLSTTTDGATIQYKLDDGEWMDYTVETPISVTTSTTSTTITARATKDELKDSAETTATYIVRKLEGISVTPSTRTVYSVGEKVAGEIEVTATYDDGEEKTVTGTISTDTRMLTQSAGIGKKVTVSYTEGDTTKEATFTVDVVNVEEPTKLTSYSSPNHTGSEQTYIAFGEWPQTEAVDFKPTTDPQSHGIFVDNYYVDGNDKYVKEEGKYYKVEPIVWRVLTTNYEVPEGGTAGNALLLAEKILTGGIRWADSSNNYMKSYIRQWLNGNSGTGETSDYGGDAGFLQTAFTESAWKLIIADTTVDNSDASTTDAGNNLTQATGYACANTTDKVFLLSEEEVTTSEYGFAAYNAAGQGNTRIRVTTDYAKATGAYQGDFSAGCGGWWWLRSPYCFNERSARDIYYDGDANNHSRVDFTLGGVVPALSISLQ